jgi:hypothetical protein
MFCVVLWCKQQASKKQQEARREINAKSEFALCIAYPI